jgi:hypothetical protein
MRITTLALLAAASGGFTPAALAQQNAAPKAGSTEYAVSPASGKAKSTPDTTQIPGPSTTGNASGPGGMATAAEPTYPNGTKDPGESSRGAAAGSGVVPSPAQ